MKSAHPDEAVPSGELLVMVSGSSIELKAVVARLEKAGAKVAWLEALDGAEPKPIPMLLLCDLARDGALGAAERFCSTLPDEVREHVALVALGTARAELSDAEAALLAKARHRYRRPIDVQGLTEEILRMLRQPRASARPQSQANLRLSLEPRASPAPKASLPPMEAAPSSHPSSAAELAPDEPLSGRQSAAPAPEHSTVSPELETLLTEAERRVYAQIAIQSSDPQGSAPPQPAAEHLSDDVWDALAEPIEDDADNPVPDGLIDEVPPLSPVAADAARASVLQPADSTVPPDLWDDHVDEDTGSNIIPESEKTSGSQSPITAAGNSAGPVTLAPGQVRDPALYSEPDDSARSEADGPATQTPGPPSTAPPGQKRLPDTRPPAGAQPYTRGSALSDAEPEPSAADGTLRPDEARPSRRSEGAPSQQLELPGALVRGASALVMGRSVRQRFSGCLAFEVDQGLRRVVLKDGDVVIAASAVHGESLVAFLSQRGDIASDTAAQIEHRVPIYGRHAGAALIARGLLEQSDLWPVLRAHAEWVLAQLLSIERGAVQIEYPVPERLAAEPAVFGGATGAEVLVEVIQRAIPPTQALAYLGSETARLVPGNASALLTECALSSRLTELVKRAEQVDLGALLAEARDEPMLPCVLYALTVLEVLEVREAPRRPAKEPKLREAEAPDQLDDEALRAKVLARRALVDEGDYFALLGVPRQATGYDIRRSYTELRRQFDPGQVLRPNTLDLQEDIGTILEVLDEAYEILRDQARRERYRRAIESIP
jgi:hypothetical protein